MGYRWVVWLTVAVLTCFALASDVDAVAAVVWDEATNGDISANRLSPTSVVLGFGSNSVVGTTQSGDLDYLSIKVLPGSQFTQLVLKNYAGIDFTSFIAVQAGTTFTAAPPAPPVGSLLGYSHFGPGASFGAQVGDDLMYALGTAPGAMGFTAPLPSGDYTFWIQQTGAATEYQFDFVVVPEPASSLMVVGAAVLLAFCRSRRSA